MTKHAAHYRLIGNRAESFSGMGIKQPDFLIAFACSACHAVVDSTKDPQVVIDFLKACMRTIEIMWREGILRC